MPDTVIIHLLQQLQASALLNGLSFLTTRKDTREGSRQYYLSTLLSEQRCLSEQQWHYICLTPTTPTHWQQRSPFSWEINSNSMQPQIALPEHIKFTGEVKPDLKRVLHNQGSCRPRKTFIWAAECRKKLRSWMVPFYSLTCTRPLRARMKAI